MLPSIRVRRLLLPAAAALGLAATRGAAQPAPQAALPHYLIDATVDPSHGTIAATVIIRLSAGQTGVRRFLLGPTYTIRSVSAEGGAVDTATVDVPFPQVRLITLRSAGTGLASMRVEYDGPLFEMSAPPINQIGPDLVELSVDSFWLPYSDDLGAPFTATATIRGLLAGGTAVSNVPSRMVGGVLHLESGPTGTSDLALVASPTLRSDTTGGFQVVASDPSSPLAAYYRTHGRGAIRYLEAVVGPMPGGGAATITIVRRERKSGYARPGYVVVTESPGTVPGPAQAKFVAHEFTHLWFSRASLTGEDYWLVEAPAEYFGLRYVRDAFGEEAAESLLGAVRTRAAAAPAILGAGRAPDAALYAKAPLLLFGLEQRIGRAGIDRVFSRLAAEPRHTTALFLSILTEVAGADVARDFEAQLQN